MRQIIEAFENGKRISDLPDVGDGSPFDYYTEVLDTDGESKKALLASMLPYTEESCSYGVEFDTTVSDPTCTRIGSTDLHKRCPVQSRMRGCLLNDDGEVVEYLNPKDWTGHDRSGARGQVMVEIPLHYRKFETEGDKRRVKLSEYPLPGYHQVPLMYVSAYEAALQRSTSKLCSVVNNDADFMGGDNTATNDGDEGKTLLGRPVTNVNRTNFRTYARNRKDGDTRWNCMTYDAHKTLYWLFVVEYATLNSQAEYKAELNDGYRQGGLGNGVTTLNSTKWSNFNGNYPFIPCGHTDELGNGTGVKDFTMPTEYGESGKKVSVPRYHGIENPFGHIMKIVDGINVQIQANDSGGKSKVYVCSDPSKFNDTNYDGYSYVGDAARTNGWIKEIIFGETGDIIPKEINGNSTQYFCDYFYTTIPSSSELLCISLVGNNANSKANAGFVSSFFNVTGNHISTSIGSRLCFIPK